MCYPHWPPGSRATGVYPQKKDEKNCRHVPGAGRPAAGRPAPPGRLAAGRPALPPLYKSWLVPPLLICITTIPETKKKERGMGRGEALPDF